jgi:ATP-dependent exoDNAse (exonuclease V) alpha subunit
VDRAIELYRNNRRLHVGNRDEMIATAVDDWYRHVTATDDLTAGLLIAHDNDTVAELNKQARTRLAASRRLNGPGVETTERDFQAGDRILCRQNQPRLDVLNGDLGTIDAVNPDSGSLTVRLDRDPQTRVLPSWYLEVGHVDYGYALTGHKAQGVTTSRAFAVIDGGTDREWVYVALSRGRQANTLYLANPTSADEQCTHLTHPERGDPIDVLVASLGRRAAENPAIDHAAGPPPPSRDVAERAAWIVARRRAERDGLGQTPPGIGLTAGR